MISYSDMKESIAAAISKAFGGAVVSDDPFYKIEGPSFLIKVVSSTPTRFSPTHAHRLYHFDIVYFAPPETPIHEIDLAGQQLAEAFIWPLEFAGRHIQPTNITTIKVDHDFHVEFDLDFYDTLPQPEYEYMGELDINFRLTLEN